VNDFITVTGNITNRVYAIRPGTILEMEQADGFSKVFCKNEKTKNGVKVYEVKEKLETIISKIDQ
jgi:hypothetical protein